MLVRKWFAVAVGLFWLTFWTLFLQVEGGKHHRHHQQQNNNNNDYSEESGEWDWKLQQFKYLIDKGGRKAGCGTDSALIAILLFLPLVGLLGLIAPLMLFIFPLLLGTPAVVSAGGGPEVTVTGRRRKRSLDELMLRVVPHLNRTTAR